MIDFNQPEGKTFEYKRDLSSPKPLLKTLVDFANSACGQVVFEYTVEGKLAMEATK